MADEDSTGPSRHLQLRTMQDMCSGWLILHKVSPTLWHAYTAAVRYLAGHLYKECMVTLCKESGLLLTVPYSHAA